MKQSIKVFLLFALLACTDFLSCASKPDPAEGISMEEGIENIAREIEESLPAGTRIAVVNFKTPSARFSDYVLEELQGILIQHRKLVVVDRKNLELLRNELNFQMSGDVSDETAISIGHWVGAQTIITGSLTDLGGKYRFRFGAIDIETAVWQVSAPATVRHDSTIAFLMPPDQNVPALSAKSEQQLATVYFNSGFAHYEAGRFDAAIADFSRALEIKSDDEAALRYRGCAYLAKQSFNEAIADFDRLIRVNPASELGYLGRGGGYILKSIANKTMADYARAMNDFNQAIRINPASEIAYIQRANLYILLGDNSKALDDFNTAIRVNPRAELAYVFRAGHFIMRGLFDEGMADYDRALKINPASSLTYLFRGNIFLIMEEYEDALADFNQIIRLHPQLEAGYLMRGKVYYEMGNYRLARADWEYALRLNPDNTDARNNLEALRREGH